MSRPRSTTLKPGRLESLVECVFSIAMTILVLDVKLPEGVSYTSDQLWTVLAAQGGILYNYVLSFALLGVFWIIHNRQFRHLERTNAAHVWLNIGMLACVALVPFTTQLFHLDREGRTADILFAANLLCIGLFMLGSWECAVRAKLLGPEVTPEDAAQGTRANLAMPLAATLALGLAFVIPGQASWAFLSIPLLVRLLRR